MRPFIHDDFLLESEVARTLYHEFAASMPIIDYHCHLDPKEIAEDQRWENLTQVWLYGDHYKWRAMRTNGIEEHYVTGNAPDRDRWNKWVETVPYTVRNPLYHWSHLELTRYFGISDLISSDTADSIWERSQARLAEPDMSAQGLIKASNVKVIGTTDDPADDLNHHRAIRENPDIECKVLPTWRPDAAFAIDQVEKWNAYLDRLGGIVGRDISTIDGLMEALQERHDFFHEQGCRLSDHGFEQFYADEFTQAEIKAIFEKVRRGKAANELEMRKFKSFMLLEGGRMDHARDWVQQFHYGATRNNNSRLFAQLGADSGLDSITDSIVGRDLNRFLDALDCDDRLAKTIIYNLNPAHNHLVVSAIGNFQDGSCPGKLQHGSGWWFLDQKDGMERQMEILSQLGLLRRFVGMLTDSRSFLSYTRHEYFRRILCNILGRDVEQGLIPSDLPLLGGMVQDICYNNAARYFDFGVEPVS